MCLCCEGHRDGTPSRPRDVEFCASRYHTSTYKFKPPPPSKCHPLGRWVIRGYTSPIPNHTPLPTFGGTDYFISNRLSLSLSLSLSHNTHTGPACWAFAGGSVFKGAFCIAFRRAFCDLFGAVSPPPFQHFQTPPFHPPAYMTGITCVANSGQSGLGDLEPCLCQQRFVWRFHLWPGLPLSRRVQGESETWHGDG